MSTAVQPIKTRVAEPAVQQIAHAERPEEMRYGWCPFGDINLMNADGTINLYVQPADVEIDGQIVKNEYHRSLPKNQLIPFPTFNLLEQGPSPDKTDSQGRAILENHYRTMTALDAATAVLSRYANWGFTVPQSLQGVEQDMAFRIFQVVQPLNYVMKDLPIELGMGADARIEATEPITFAEIPGYVVQPLRNDAEREIARNLAAEMIGGADIALALATETLNDTETSMVRRHSGGQGKTGPDALDKRMCAELGRALPQLIGTPAENTLEQKVDLLLDDARSRRLEDENAKLRAELAAAKGGEDEPEPQTPTVPKTPTTPQVPENPNPERANVQTGICGAIKDNGEPCRIPTKGGRCGLHPEQQ